MIININFISIKIYFIFWKNIIFLFIKKIVINFKMDETFANLM